MEDSMLKIVCAWCGKDMGEKGGGGVEGTSHSICENCKVEYFPESYPESVRRGWIVATRVKARKDHKCSACGLLISTGTYHYSKYFGGGLPDLKFPEREHLDCLLTKKGEGT